MRESLPCVVHASRGTQSARMKRNTILLACVLALVLLSSGAWAKKKKKAKAVDATVTHKVRGIASELHSPGQSVHRSTSAIYA